MNNNFNFLAHEFILNSPKFEDDLSIQEIDTKHQGIVGNAYKKMNEKKFQRYELRSKAINKQLTLG